MAKIRNKDLHRELKSGEVFGNKKVMKPAGILCGRTYYWVECLLCGSVTKCVQCSVLKGKQCRECGTRSYRVMNTNNAKMLKFMNGERDATR